MNPTIRLNQECEKFAKTFADLKKVMPAIDSATFTAPDIESGGQADLMLSAVRTAEAGAQVKERQVKAYAAINKYYSDAEHSTSTMIKGLEEMKQAILAQNPRGLDGRDGVVYEGSLQEFRSLNEEAKAGEADTEAKMTALGVDISKLHSAMRGIRPPSALMDATGQVNQPQTPGAPGAAPPAAPGGTTAPSTPGVPTSTWVALGGAALIAGGTVAGIAYFGNKALDKVDKISEQRVKDIEAVGERLMVKMRIEATGVIAEAEATAGRIMEKARTEATTLTATLMAQVTSQIKNLTEEGVKTLRQELTKMFDGLIAKAKAEGNSALEKTLTDTRNSLLKQIEDELKKRAGGVAGVIPIPATSTSTGTSTSTTTGT